MRSSPCAVHESAPVTPCSRPTAARTALRWRRGRPAWPAPRRRGPHARGRRTAHVQWIGWNQLYNQLQCVIINIRHITVGFASEADILNFLDGQYRANYVVLEAVLYTIPGITNRARWSSTNVTPVTPIIPHRAGRLPRMRQSCVWGVKEMPFLFTSRL